jgi:hypothetical protein
MFLKDCIVMSECGADVAGINSIILIGDAKRGFGCGCYISIVRDREVVVLMCR